MCENKLIIVASFGTSHRESINRSLTAIEQEIADAFTGIEVRRAFTSRMVLDILKKKENLHIEHLEDVLKQAAEEGIESVIVQPTHFLKGNDYKKLEELVLEYNDKFDELLIGEPLLNEESDFEILTEALLKRVEPYTDGQTAVCFVGHGVDAQTNEAYRILQEKLRKNGADHCYIGTIKGSPEKEMILAQMRKQGICKKVVLFPLMIVAGAHAVKEMAGDEEGTWKSLFEQSGYEVECVQIGLGEYPEVRKLFAEHMKTVISRRNR